MTKRSYGEYISRRSRRPYKVGSRILLGECTYEVIEFNVEAFTRLYRVFLRKVDS